jgi:uncharacterized membrane protein YbhN (UPF0104 family)
MKVLVFILCIIVSLATIMFAMKMANQPNWLWNLGAIASLFLLGYSVAKTKCFTNFKRTNNEENVN